MTDDSSPATWGRARVRTSIEGGPPGAVHESWKGEGIIDFATGRSILRDRPLSPRMVSGTVHGRRDRLSRVVLQLASRGASWVCFDNGQRSVLRGDRWWVRERVEGQRHPRDPLWLLAAADDAALGSPEEVELHGEAMTQWRGTIEGRAWPTTGVCGRTRLISAEMTGERTGVIVIRDGMGRPRRLAWGMYGSLWAISEFWDFGAHGLESELPRPVRVPLSVR